MTNRFMTMEEIKKVPVEEMVRLMEEEECMTPCEYYIEHDEVPEWLKFYNKFVTFICYSIGRDILRPFFIFLLGKKTVATEEYVTKHHKIRAKLHFFACLILGATLTGRVIDCAFRLLRYALTGELPQ